MAQPVIGPEIERLIQLPPGYGGTRARIYTPAGPARQTVLLVSGLHPAGIDEPRLMAFGRELARTGVTVVTPEVPGLPIFDRGHPGASSAFTVKLVLAKLVAMVFHWRSSGLRQTSVFRIYGFRSEGRSPSSTLQ